MNFDDHEENTLSKKEKTREKTIIFSNSHQVFLTMKDEFDAWITIEFVVCKLTRLKFCHLINDSN